MGHLEKDIKKEVNEIDDYIAKLSCYMKNNSCNEITDYKVRIDKLINLRKKLCFGQEFDFSETLTMFVEGMPISKFVSQAEFNKQQHRISLLNNKIYQNRQFEDAKLNLDQCVYNKWIKSAKKRFIHTIPVDRLLMSSKNVYNLGFHYSEKELNSITTLGYSPKQIFEILKLLDKIKIMLLLSNELKLGNYFKSEFTNNELDYIEQYIIGEYFAENGKSYIIGSQLYGTKTIYYKEVGQSNYNIMSANEFLFRALKLPISTILNSINQALNPRILENEKINEINVSNELKTRLSNLVDSEKQFNELVKKERIKY